MLRRALPALLVSSALAIGCNLLTGVGELEAEDTRDASALPTDGATSGAITPDKDAAGSSSSGASSSSGSPLDAAPDGRADASDSQAPGDAGTDTGSDALAPIDSGPKPTTRDFNGHRYTIVFDRTTWPDAKTKAEQAGGHLVTITSAEENDFVRQLAKDSGLWADDSVYGGWLGAERLPVDGGYAGPDLGWTWVTNEPFGYTNWLAGEPNNSGDSEMYLGFYQSNAEGLWNDWNESGDGSMPGYIVELDAIP